MVLSICLVLGLIMPLSTPAHAIFGLSTCEKVKKQVLSLEEKINQTSNFWWKYKDKALPESLVTKFINQQNPQNDYVMKRTKIVYNNPKCFTRTQNEKISEFRKQGVNFNSIVVNTRKATVKNTKNCQDIWEQLSPSTECLIKWNYSIGTVYTLDSIYSY